MSVSTDTTKFLSERAELLRWIQKQIDEMDEAVWFEPSRTFSRRKSDSDWTEEGKNVQCIGSSTERSRKMPRVSVVTTTRGSVVDEDLRSVRGH